MAQVRGADLLTGMAQALNRAQSLRASYSITPIGGASTDYTVELSKPNLARVDTPRRLVIATGREIVTYDKSDNAFIRRPELEGDVARILAPTATEIFTPFVNPDYFKQVVNPRSTGQVTRRGLVLQGVQYSTGSFPLKQWTMYVSPEDQLLRQAQFVLKTDTGAVTSIYDLRTVSTDALPADRFEWKAPSDAKELTWDDVSKGNWFTDLDEAGLAANLTDRLVFVVFYADWSHGSKGLDLNVFSKDEFKKMSDSFVFCKVESAKSEVFEQFKVTEVPTMFVLRPDGSIVRKIVGYMALNQLLAAMQAARSAAGSTAH